MTDEEHDPLIDRVRRHDAVALASFLERRKPALFAFVTNRLGSTLRGKLEPADVLQELAVKAIRELPQTDLTGRDPFGWLCHLAEQCIVDDHRHFAAGKRAAEREVPGNVPVGEGSQDLVALLAASMTTPTQAVVRNERQQRLLDVLATFPAEHREALRLRYVDGLPTKDVAARLKKSDVATRVLLTRLVQKLQELLGPGEES
ncbi:RNA polymerase sigma factor [Fimbriiglobus ruber]|uniref:RNA polymerase sigma-54 factor RpoN n=1 Tax=Fimbriiglobus ruber TaxID=1908690 RepID=A0A225D4E4_9BACT|nr:sigma-70 family RNA polymerase sigma factor [Fimbriiglobus ruber]OWK34514.1 RNA polymerase sigma-54 factor RpoN [Fimbriiglobus ruber]